MNNELMGILKWKIDEWYAQDIKVHGELRNFQAKLRKNLVRINNIYNEKNTPKAKEELLLFLNGLEKPIESLKKSINKLERISDDLKK